MQVKFRQNVHILLTSVTRAIGAFRAITLFSSHKDEAGFSNEATDFFSRSFAYWRGDDKEALNI